MVDGILVGRGRELAALHDFLDRTARGAGGATVVVAEPGGGKSTVLDALERDRTDFRVIRVRGVLVEAVLPYAGLQQLIYAARSLVDRLPEPQAHALRAAMGVERELQADRYLVSVATLSLLSEAAADRPLLVLVDDIPWVDAASRDALLFASRRLGGEPVAIVMASRTDDWSEIGDEGLPVVELPPLDAAAIADLFATRAAVRPQEDVARRVAALTAGNPLAVVEFAPELSAEQLIGRAPMPAHLPLTRGLERTFAARVAELPPDVQRALLVLAADDTGRPHVVEAAARRLDVPASTLRHAVQHGLASDRDGAIELRHPLIRSAVYARASVDERRAVHTTLADVLDADDPDRATWHRAAAAVERDAATADSLAQLAGRARARGAPEEAMAAWARAAELHPDPGAAADAVLAGAAAGWAAGRLDRARALLDSVSDAGFTDAQRIEAASIRGGIELAAGDASRAYRTLVAAADIARSTDPERSLLILNVAAEAGSLANDRAATANLDRHAPELPADASDRMHLLHAALLGFAADFAGDVASAVRHLRESVAVAERVDDPALQLIAGRAAIYCGDDEAARQLHLAVVEDARRRGTVDLIPLAAPRLATAEMLLGRWPSAAATAAESSRIADETGQLLLAPHGRATLALLAAMRGDAKTADGHLDAALSGVSDRPMGLIEDDGHWTHGILALGRGDHDMAVAHLERITHPVVQLLSSLDRVEAAHATGDSRLTEWSRPIEPLAGADGPAWAVARQAYVLALAADGADEAWHHYEASLAAAERSGRPFERARIQLAAGAHLRRNRHRVEARRHLRTAAATLDLLGAAPWAARAHAELRASGETVTRAPRASVERLTAQELQVARAVGEGYTNKEVAARLFLSPRTVEFHLRNVFAKLEVTSRAQLARVPLGDPAAG